jgi:multiple sugar transport system substrate-binding protein
MGYARVPAGRPGKPSRVSIGGATSASPVYGKHPELATKAALCMTSPQVADAEAINEGLPPVMNAAYDDPKVRKVYPFADLLREQLKDAVRRPETPVLLRRDARGPDVAAPAASSTRSRRSTR